MALVLDKSLSLARLLLKVQKQTSVKSTSFIQCDQIIFVSTFGHFCSNENVKISLKMAKVLGAKICQMLSTKIAKDR